MNIAALRKIADSLDALANEADDEHPIDPFAIRHAVRQLRAQAEMEEQGLDA